MFNLTPTDWEILKLVLSGLFFVALGGGMIVLERKAANAIGSIPVITIVGAAVVLVAPLFFGNLINGLRHPPTHPVETLLWRKAGVTVFKIVRPGAQIPAYTTAEYEVTNTSSALLRLEAVQGASTLWIRTLHPGEKIIRTNPIPNIKILSKRGVPLGFIAANPVPATGDGQHAQASTSP